LPCVASCMSVSHSCLSGSHHLLLTFASANARACAWRADARRPPSRGGRGKLEGCAEAGMLARGGSCCSCAHRSSCAAQNHHR
jgi:hypothetical protein